jgi:hypothetical protein
MNEVSVLAKMQIQQEERRELLPLLYAVVKGCPLLEKEVPPSSPGPHGNFRRFYLIESQAEHSPRSRKPWTQA